MAIGRLPWLVGGATVAFLAAALAYTGVANGPAFYFPPSTLMPALWGCIFGLAAIALHAVVAVAAARPQLVVAGAADHDEKGADPMPTSLAAFATIARTLPEWLTLAISLQALLAVALFPAFVGLCALGDANGAVWTAAACAVAIALLLAQRPALAALARIGSAAASSQVPRSRCGCCDRMPAPSRRSSGDDEAGAVGPAAVKASTSSGLLAGQHAPEGVGASAPGAHGATGRVAVVRSCCSPCTCACGWSTCGIWTLLLLLLVVLVPFALNAPMTAEERVRFPAQGVSVSVPSGATAWYASPSTYSGHMVAMNWYCTGARTPSRPYTVVFEAGARLLA